MTSHIESMVIGMTASERNEGLYKHLRQTMGNAGKLVTETRLDLAYYNTLETSAWLHDIGKLEKIANDILGRNYESDYEKDLLHAIVSAKFVQNMGQDGIANIIARHTPLQLDEAQLNAVQELHKVEDKHKIFLPSSYSGKIDFAFEGLKFQADELTESEKIASKLLIIADVWDKERAENVIKRKPWVHADSYRKNLYRVAGDIGLEARFIDYKVL